MRTEPRSTRRQYLWFALMWMVSVGLFGLTLSALRAAMLGLVGG